MEMKFNHKEMTDEESYNNVKKMHKENPDLIMSPERWKKLQLERLRREGKVWSK